MKPHKMSATAASSVRGKSATTKNHWTVRPMERDAKGVRFQLTNAAASLAKVESKWVGRGVKGIIRSAVVRVTFVARVRMIGVIIERASHGPALTTVTPIPLVLLPRKGFEV